jgi:hypothetical protein
MPDRRRKEEEIPRQGNRSRGERYNTRSTFETFRYNTYNIRLKVDETLKIYSLRPTNKNTSSTWAPRSMKLINYTATPIKVADSTENYSKMNKPTTVV